MKPTAHANTLIAGALPPGLARWAAYAGLVLVGTLVLAVAAKTKVPFYPVPMTLQTLAIMAIAGLFGSRLAVATVVAYLAEGMLGLPVFTNTPPLAAGPAYFLGPTGGFLVGFVAAAAIVGAAADRGWAGSLPRMLAAMVAAEAVVMALGFAWLAWFATLSSGATGLGMSSAFAAGVAPFLLGDLLKLVLAALLVAAVSGIRRRRSGTA